MAVEDDLATLRAKLLQLKNALLDAGQTTTDASEHKRIESALDLPNVTLARIDDFLAGRRDIPARNIFQSTIGNCTRGFSEIGADATESPGRIGGMIKDILDFSIACRQRA